MTYLQHAQLSAERFGGKAEDYIELHELMDSTKNFHPSFQHRIFAHNTWFVDIVCRLKGHVIVNSDGKEVMVRDILYQHMKEDHGRVLTIKDWLSVITLKSANWVNNPLKFEDEQEKIRRVTRQDKTDRNI